MTVLRFLRSGAYDPFTGVTWSEEWVAPAEGVVAYASDHLPRWISNELWRVELDGDVMEREFSVVARRGRLVSREPGWDMPAAAAFVEWLVGRHPGLAYEPAAGTWTPAWEAAYVAAHTAAMDAEAAGMDYDAGERAEWAEQAAWLRTHLHLG